MKIGILGKKLGMTEIFTEEGEFVPVTVIEAGPCTVLKMHEGRALLSFRGRIMREFEFETDEDISPGKDITVDIFREKDFIDVSGTSKGKGFQGGVKRWGWRGGPDSHGSMHHRRVGSIGGSSFPSRVWKGQKFPGRMGNKRNTVQNLRVIKVYKDRNIMLVKGPVPGAKNGYLEIRSAKKKPLIRTKKENG